MIRARSLDDLHFERHYLLCELQKANRRATELLQRIFLLEEIIIRTEDNKIRRKTKKRAGWLKSRVAEIARQQQALLTCLARLLYDIQSKQWLMQKESERAYYEQLMRIQLSRYYSGGDMSSFGLISGSSSGDYYAAGLACDNRHQSSQYRRADEHECQSWCSDDSPSSIASSTFTGDSLQRSMSQMSKDTELDYTCNIPSKYTTHGKATDNQLSLPRPASSCGRVDDGESEEDAAPLSKLRRNSCC